MTQEEPDQEQPFFIFPNSLFQAQFDLPASRILHPEERERIWASKTSGHEISMETWAELATSYFAENQYARFMDVMTKIRSQKEVPTSLALIEALALEAQGDWTGALAAWNRLRSHKPEDITPAYRIGLCYLHLAQGETAFQWFRALALHYPDEPRVHHLLGAMYWYQGRNRMAWRSLARAATSSDALPETFLFLAWIADQDGDGNEALGWLRRGLELMDPPEQAFTLRSPLFEQLQGHPAFAHVRDQLAIPEDIARWQTEGEAGPHTSGVTVFTREPAATLPGETGYAIRLRADAPIEEALTDEFGIRMRPAPATESESEDFRDWSLEL